MPMPRFQYAPVAPIGILEEIYGPYNLVLAHEVLRHRDRYQRLFKRIKHEYGDAAYTIVDNGVIETGESAHLEHLAEAASVVYASVIVLPDVIRDGEETLQQSYRAANFLRKRSSFKFMGVAQGNTPEEASECAVHLEQEIDLSALAVPRPMPRGSGARGKTLELLAKDTTLPIHLLGFSGAPEDDHPPQKGDAAQFMGIDSAEPIWRHFLPKATSRPDTYWEWEYVNPSLRHKIKMLQGRCH